MGYIDQLPLREQINALEGFLIENKKHLVKFYENNKRYTSSPFEKKMTKILEDNFEKDLREEFDSFLLFDKVQASTWNKPIVIFPDLKRIGEFKEFPKDSLVMPYTIDKKIGKFCFEMNGPHHYFQNEENQYFLDGYARLKKYFMEKIGLSYIEIPYF